MKTEADIRARVERWLSQDPTIPVLTLAYQSGYYQALADVLEDHDLKRRVAEWFRRAEEAK